MEFVYTTRTSGFESGKQYRNPRFFDRPDPKATSVVIEGEWPAIKAAYEKADVKVEVKAPAKQKTGSGAQKAPAKQASTQAEAPKE
ncbi:hypothetical protein [Halomonas caseinilytica]|uniref:hypothetical protein n=1 Tax=Halomonas caseinilytica TaxID=438744 RepID=UPI0007E59D5D|nr:hypothetical protein [Halomonas caseinilytica]SEN65083.1 hypothetical protein SAMN04487952_12312 [Halomonas caseinilytica]